LITTVVPMIVSISHRVYAKGSPSTPNESSITIGISSAKIPAEQFPIPPKTD